MPDSPFLLFLFVPVVLTAYLLVPARLRALFLLLASLAFYVWAGRLYVLVLALAIAGNYGIALLLQREDAGAGIARLRRLALALALVFDLALLIGCRTLASRAVGASLGPLRLGAHDVPVGVSFLSLALMSYVLDVYRRQVDASRDPIRFGAYVSLFPKVVAGPIVRWRDLAAQLVRPRLASPEMAEGAWRLVTGLAKKRLIADTLATVADQVFATPARGLTAATAWLGVLCFALQLYYDFSGYSDMAIGLGRLLGLRFPENFAHPYAARSLREFWTRWHISLSTWLRDYLYLPIAYALSRRIRSDRLLHVRAEMVAYAGATLVTMLLCGLWHRASWTCALWGLWHGAVLVTENSRGGKRLLRRAGGPLRFALTQWAVLMGWVLFRSGTLGQAASLFRVMYGLGGAGRGVEPLALPAYLDRPVVVALGVGLAFCVPLGPRLVRWWLDRTRAAREAHAWARVAFALGLGALLLGILLVGALSLAEGTYAPFVYQQF